MDLGELFLKSGAKSTRGEEALCPRSYLTQQGPLLLQQRFSLLYNNSFTSCSDDPPSVLKCIEQL